MMRALYTAASGMISQQTNVDVIANNLANVNSVGYKSQRAEFKSLLYQTLQTRSTSANGDEKPVAAQVGTGTRTASIATSYAQGSVQESDNTFSFAIMGDGFFAFQAYNGETNYTRNGNFQMAVLSEDEGGGFMLCTQEGYPVLDTDGQTIVFDSDMTTSLVQVTSDGTFCYPDEDNNYQSLGIQIGLYQFTNPAGLESVGETSYRETEASGLPMEEHNTDGIQMSSLKQGYLESSNVQVADEMVNLIVAQRAYEMNSKAIQTADTMMEEANQLKR